ncbi:MAG TPA: alpha-ribazole phosphatase [Terriglobales bacterium]|nr:alpha-ribazole phosphatase [Terriglobales bacterium]
MMPKHTLYLVRHGELIVEERHRFLGQLDVPLSPGGIGQARTLHKMFRRVSLSRVYCSDLSRSRETAEIIVGTRGIPLRACVELREVSLGLWEGCALSDIRSRYPKQFRARGEDLARYQPPGGESFEDCQTRVRTTIQKILAHPPGEYLIVGHAGVNRVILCEALAVPLAELFRIPQDYGCLNVVEYEGGAGRVKLLNFNFKNALQEANPVASERDAVFVS